MKTHTYITREVIRRAILALMAALLLATLVGSGWAEMMMSPEKPLPVGGSEVMDFQNIRRAAVSDPTVADYVVLSAKQIMVTGKAAGTTDFYVWDDKGQHKFRVMVTAPPSRMPETVSKIREALAQPEIKVSEHNGVILLEGEVQTAAESDRAAAIAGAYAPKVDNLIHVVVAAEKPKLDVAAIQAAIGPNIKVSALTENTLLFEGNATPQEKARLDQIVRGLGGRVGVVDAVSAPAYEPRQIMVHVKVVDIDRSAERDVGIDWGGLTTTSSGGVTTGTAHDQPVLLGEARDFPLALNEGGPIRRLEGLSARFKALETANKARILAEPNLLVTEGQLASILVGGEIPIPVVQSTSGAGTSAAGAITVEWKEFGVRLEIKGNVTGEGKAIDLDVTTEVSSLDFGNAIVVSNIVLPALKTRRAHSVLHMKDGQTLVIGGLYQTQYSKNVRRIPILGELPIIGQFFSRTDKTRSDTELVILVTPQIMTEATAAAQTQAAMEKVREKP